MQTLVGDLDESVLECHETITGTNEWNTCFATEWFYEGAMVRRDVHVVVHKLPPLEPTSEM